jgi:hypothetical protein
MKLVHEQTMLKLLIERTGFLLAVTLKRRAFYFFMSSKLVGMRVTPTTDPYPGIVEVCGFDIPRIVANWDRLSNVKLREPPADLRPIRRIA